MLNPPRYPDLTLVRETGPRDFGARQGIARDGRGNEYPAVLPAETRSDLVRALGYEPGAWRK